ncbi:NUDIX hydrolase [Mitsuaria sp. TWR114]|uniref:NUDIX hydrolase n=1 Tax=Mitsuaria sp. TWR114 TaxID=2601731 RepID=UPI00164C6773|nr:NUDIX domain-containing protein [Mitsuaria sp. TWR114]
MTASDLRAHALDQLNRYLEVHPQEREELGALMAQLLEDPADVFARANMRGHVTTSGIVYDARADKVLMIHHKVLDRWLQPGGHHEGIDRLDVSAAREVREETGVERFAPCPAGAGGDLPFDVESHAIRANPAKGEGDHVHHDFIYLFAADSTQPVQPELAEVKGVRWMPRAEFATLPSARFARMSEKLLALATARSPADLAPSS